MNKYNINVLLENITCNQLPALCRYDIKILYIYFPDGITLHAVYNIQRGITWFYTLVCSCSMSCTLHYTRRCWSRMKLLSPSFSCHRDLTHQHWAILSIDISKVKKFQTQQKNMRSSFYQKSTSEASSSTQPEPSIDKRTRKRRKENIVRHPELHCTSTPCIISY